MKVANQTLLYWVYLAIFAFSLLACSSSQQVLDENIKIQGEYVITNGMGKSLVFEDDNFAFVAEAARHLAISFSINTNKGINFN